MDALSWFRFATVRILRNLLNTMLELKLSNRSSSSSSRAWRKVGFREPPFPEIKYDCIVSSDDDWYVDEYLLTYMFETWRGNFFNYLIGHFRLARSYKKENGVTTYFDVSERISDGVSIMLPGGGSIFHKKYLYRYHGESFLRGREIVSQLFNGEDLLMNFVIASKVRKGPVIIHYWQEMLDVAYSGLWSRKSHVSDRGKCIQLFNEMYGNVLRYHTTVEFNPNRVYGAARVAGLHHYQFKEKV